MPKQAQSFSVFMTKPFTTVLAHISLLLMKRGGVGSPGRPRTGSDKLNLLIRKRTIWELNCRPTARICHNKDLPVQQSVALNEAGSDGRGQSV